MAVHSESLQVMHFGIQGLFKLQGTPRQLHKTEWVNIHAIVTGKCGEERGLWTNLSRWYGIPWTAPVCGCPWWLWICRGWILVPSKPVPTAAQTVPSELGMNSSECRALGCEVPYFKIRPLVAILGKSQATWTLRSVSELLKRLALFKNSEISLWIFFL